MKPLREGCSKCCGSHKKEPTNSLGQPEESSLKWVAMELDFEGCVGVHQDINRGETVTEKRCKGVP